MYSVPQVFNVSRLKGDVLVAPCQPCFHLDLGPPSSVLFRGMRGLNLKISPPFIDRLCELVQHHSGGGVELVYLW